MHHRFAAGIIAAFVALLALATTARAQECTISPVYPAIESGPSNAFASLPLTTTGSCPSLLNASSSAPWLQSSVATINPAGSFVSLALDTNQTGASRTAVIFVNGSPLITFTQRSTPCVASVTPGTHTFPVGGGTVTFQVQTLIPNCFWSATGFPPPPLFSRPFANGWAFPTGTNSYGAGTAPFTAYDIGSHSMQVTAATNGFNTTARSATLFFGGGPSATIDQPAPTCQFTFSPVNVDVAANGGTIVANLTGVGTDCSYTSSIFMGSSWLTITSGGSGVAPSTLTITAAPNTTPDIRIGQIFAVNGILNVNQAGPPIALDYGGSPFIGLPFGAWRLPDGSVQTTAAEPIRVTNIVDANASWSATASQPWVVLSPSSGTTPATLSVSIDPVALAAQAPGSLGATIDIVSPTAPQTPRRITVVLNYYGGVPGAQKPFIFGEPPLGVVDTPIEAATGLSGAIPITGWAVDRIGITRITIYRAPMPNEGTAPVFIGDGVRVFGARPDLLQFYSGFPEARTAGWGYMLLSNVLPNGGNGTFTFSAYADDAEGNHTLLGTKTVTIDNLNAMAPFGTIDFPAPGQVVSGTLMNIGWALTPKNKTIPPDGSTIKVYIDGALVGPVTSYNIPRPDVTAFFPSLNNSAGPQAQLAIDTRLLTDGVHTIAWGVIDDGGAPAGLGSRYFTVNNGASSLLAGLADSSRAASPVLRMPVLANDVWSRGGFDDTGWATRIDADARGRRTVHVARGERVELFLDPMLQAACGTYEGHLIAREVAAPLPFGSSLDRERGIFRWQPGAETAGTFDFTFVQRGCDARERTIPIRVIITP